MHLQIVVVVVAAAEVVLLFLLLLAGIENGVIHLDLQSHLAI